MIWLRIGTGGRLLGRSRRILKDNIKRDFQEVECVSMGWTYLTQDRDRWRAVVNAVMNLEIP